MKGNTVAFNLEEETRPTERTTPFFLVELRAVTNVLPPTESIVPAQTSLSNDLPESSSTDLRSRTSEAPSFFKNSLMNHLHNY